MKNFDWKREFSFVLVWFALTLILVSAVKVVFFMPVSADGFDLQNVTEYYYLDGDEISLSPQSSKQYFKLSSSELPVAFLTLKVDNTTYRNGEIKSDGVYINGSRVITANSLSIKYISIPPDSAKECYSVETFGANDFPVTKTVNPIAVTHSSDIANGVGKSIGFVGETLSLLTGSELLPYLGLIIGISLFTGVIAYIKIMIL